MAHFFPLSKVVVFTLKSAVKPLSKFIVGQTKNNEHFIKGCEVVAETNRKVYDKIYSWSGNKLPKSMRDIKPLTNVEAVEFCADLLGECLMLGFGGLFIYYELKKSQAHKRKSAEADAALARRIDMMEAKIESLIGPSPPKYQSLVGARTTIRKI